VKLLPLSVTASVQPVDQGTFETMETCYRDIFRNMLMKAVIMKYLDETICVRGHIWASYVCNMTMPTAISKSWNERLNVTKLRTVWGLRRMIFQLLS
jgi:hypothetical protein